MTTKVIDKLIFLDIDGVLNNRDVSRGEHDESQYYEMHQSNLSSLKRLLKETNATIVLSSAWRNSEESRSQVKKFFMKNNIPLYISITPNVGPRLGEILLWLKENTTNVDLLLGSKMKLKAKNDENNNESLWRLPKRVQVNRWIILDDINFKKHEKDVDFYYLPNVGNHVVHTKRIYGLGDKEVDKAIEKLNTPTPCEYCGLTSKEWDIPLNKIFCDSTCQHEYYELHKLT